MKKTILALTLVLTSLPAFGATESQQHPITEAICQSTPIRPDTGYELFVRASGRGRGSVLIEINQLTIAGARPFAQVHAVRDSSGYVARDFSFEIDTRSRSTDGRSPALLEVRESGKAKTQRFSCKLVEYAIEPMPPHTCPAFWRGFEFNADTDRCESAFGSGCTNPFEFRTQEACDAAHTFRRVR